jgi:hypothetical protein
MVYLHAESPNLDIFRKALEQKLKGVGMLYQKNLATLMHM